MVAKRMKRKPRDSKSSIGGKMASLFGATPKKIEPDDLPAMTPPKRVEPRVDKPSTSPMQRGARMKRLNGRII